MSPIVLPVVILIALCVLGLQYCFKGYRNLRIFVTIYGFWVGFSWVMRNYSAAGAQMWIWGLVAGAVLAALAFFLLKAAMFLAGGLFGLVIYYAISIANPALLASLSQFGGLIFFVAFGILGVLAKKPILIIATSFYGAYSFIINLGILIGVMIVGSVPAGLALSDVTESLAYMSIYNQLPSMVAWIAILVLAVVGMVRQFGRSRR